MTDAGFIFALSVGATLLAGILTAAHVAASQLRLHKLQRYKTAVAAAASGQIDQPEVSFGIPTLNAEEGTVRAHSLKMTVRHAEGAH